MTIQVELALVVGLFFIGALVLALDNVLDSAYRWIGRRFRSKQFPASSSHPRPAQKAGSPRPRQTDDGLI